MRRERTPILLVVAASRHEAARAMEAHGLDFGCMESIRIVTDAYLLRRWSSGTPYITAFRETWGSTAETRMLDDVLTLRTRCHELRPANDRDLGPLMRPVREAAE
ncbi:hypothetical protein [Martelella endophytica]|uniref:Uncharacterized protein n=1 Tax=Martelella endophytica TaxID=1486262 RepID=A0A0D5LMZ2_MAREN|nr:hypothetical protein [Martelella endophytica]AJY44678.1 hypothetical protein TM49_01655 [Martelella endophytica]